MLMSSGEGIMSYTVEILPALPVVLVTFGADFSGSEEINTYSSEMYDLFESLSEPVYIIVNVTDLNLNFDSALEFVQVSLRSDKSIARHQNIIETLVVTHSRFYQLMIKGLNTATFGNFSVKVFSSMKQALDWVQSTLTSSGGR
jgi:hypothetical protein